MTADVQLDLAVLHLVYAIGSRCLQLLNSSKVGKDLSEGHFVSAMKNIPEAMKFTSLRSIEITLLLALHSMRSPSGKSVKKPLPPIENHLPAQAVHSFYPLTWLHRRSKRLAFVWFGNETMSGTRTAQAKSS